MSHDIISDAMNKIMNAKRAKKKHAEIKTSSKLLMNILKIAKENNYIEDYEMEGKTLKVKIGELNECKAIKPRFFANNENMERFIRRYLPARDFGIILVSTNKGLLTHQEAMEKNVGGALIAYFY